MEHLHMNRPGYGSDNYYEAEKEVVRGPYDSYASDYRVQEYNNPGYSMGPRAGYTDRVSEVASYESNPAYYGRPHHHHHHRPGGAAEYVERKEDIVYENAYDPYRRAY